MIVVVIMAILVAVAVPVYVSVTNNTEKKTCATNTKILGNLLQNYKNGFFSVEGEAMLSFDGLIISDADRDANPEFSGPANASELGEWITARLQSESSACCVGGGTITITETDNGGAIVVSIQCDKHPH